MAHNKLVAIAGPWIGELGWELFCWSNFLRAWKQDHPSAHLVVICPQGHRVLYSDFASQILEHTMPVCETDMFNNTAIDPSEITHWLELARSTCPSDSIPVVIPHDSFKGRWWLEHCNHLPTYTKLGRAGTSSPFDVVMHVRQTDKCGTGYRNWPVESAQEVATWLRDLGLCVAAIGRNDSSFCPVGVFDQRGIDLSRTADLLASTSVFVGSQSGPTHLAALCGTPTVTWQTCEEHAQRVLYHWNPFDVEVLVTHPSDEFWREKKQFVPETTHIVARISHLLKKKRGN